METIPSGIASFLFTDIEGSTLIAQHYPDLCERLFSRHQAILESAITKNNGVIFLIAGDAFCAAFHSTSQAFQAALDAQQEMNSEPWDPAPIKVRMGIHTGAAQPNNPDNPMEGYNGYATLVLAQRVMSMGHGGQILLSNSSADLLKPHLPDAIQMRDMGEYRLKGLLNLERLWQVISPDLPTEFAPLRSIQITTNNLPIQLTSFVGREQEMQEIKKSLEKNRLVTLTGIGGTGKTRLSLQVAAEILDQYKDGVWFVELAPLSDPSLLARTVAEVLKIAEAPNLSIQDAIINTLKTRQSLLVLDNCEHLINACAAFVQNILRSCPQIRFLISSREGLAVSGEMIQVVSPLPLPALDRKNSLSSLYQTASVQLFIDRARSVLYDFTLEPQNADAVATICRRLDGIPLALELAAAKLKMIPVQKLSIMLEDRFRLLTKGLRTALPHQQTLRAMIDWSHDLLSEQERAVLRRLSIFAGGWTLEAAESICCGSYIESWEVLDLLGNLVDKSLVTCNCNSEIPRYFMLETLRQYSKEKLDLNSETGITQKNHGEFFLNLAETAEPQLTGNEQAKWYVVLELEHRNLQAAIEWSIISNNPEIAQRLCGALGRFWWVGGYMTEGRKWLKSALENREGVTKSTQAKALRWAGGLAWPQGDLVAAKIAFDECMILYRELEDIAGMANVLGNLGTVAQNQGDYTGAWDMFSQSLDLLRELGNKWGIANALNNLGNVAQEQGDIEKAQGLQEESLALREELDDLRGMGIALNNLGSIALEQNNLETARSYFSRSLGINFKISARMMLAYNLSGLAQVLADEEQLIPAAQLQGATTNLLEEMGASLESYEQGLYQKTAARLKKSMGDGSYLKAFETGKALPFEEIIDSALGRTELERG